MQELVLQAAAALALRGLETQEWNGIGNDEGDDEIDAS